MNGEDQTESKHEDDSLTCLRKENHRLIRAVVVLLVILTSCAFAVRFFRHSPRRPPKMAPVTNVIPGYYTEQEIGAFIQTGMPIAAVFGKFGPPAFSTNLNGGIKDHAYFAENFPRDRILKFAFSGFSVMESNGVVLSWGAMHTSTD